MSSYQDYELIQDNTSDNNQTIDKEQSEIINTPVPIKNVTVSTSPSTTVIWVVVAVVIFILIIAGIGLFFYTKRSEMNNMSLYNI